MPVEIVAVELIEVIHPAPQFAFGVALMKFTERDVRDSTFD